MDKPVPICAGLKNLLRKLHTGKKTLRKKLNIPLYLRFNLSSYGKSLEYKNKPIINKLNMYGRILILLSVLL